MTEQNKYQAVFEKFDAADSESVISSYLQTLRDKYAETDFAIETLLAIYSCIDLTTLNADDTKESVWRLVERVNKMEGLRPDLPNLAAICTYPFFVEMVKQSLLAHDVKITSVAAGFPAAQTFSEIKIAETAMVVMAGADEVDVVMNPGCFLENAFEELSDELAEIKDSCRGATLKVILETGALVTADNIRRAAILALYSGADFIKTSTGKGYPGATPEAVYVMCKVLKQYAALSGRKAGIKISGGIRSVEDAIFYYTMVKEILGEAWLNKNRFRIGSSRLSGDLEKRIGVE